MGALSHLRIVEIGSAAATGYCARLFADFGATVQKIEPPTGDPLRKAAPLTSKGNSAWFAFLNFNKSSIALDSSDAGASVRLTDLIGACDILLDGRDIDAAGCPAFDLADIKQRNPGLICLDASWFGREGPYAKFQATDSTIRALTGLIKLVGPAEGPPKIEAHPSAAQVVRFSHDLAVNDHPRVADRHHVVLPVADQLVNAGDHAACRHLRT